MEKIKNIGFLRVIFTLIIVVFHLLCQPNTLYKMYPDVYGHIHSTASFGYLAVELFFVMSGFFLFFSARKDISTKDFFINKFFRLWAVPAFAIFCIWLLSLINYTGYSKYANILHLLMLKNTGLTLRLADNGTAWFVSILFWVSVFYFYLIKNFEKKFVNLTLALIIYFSLVLLVNGTHGHFGSHYKMVNLFFNIGMLRGLAEIGIGYFIAMFFENYLRNEKTHNSCWNFKFFAASAVEIYLFTFIVQRLLFKTGNYTNDLVLFVFIVGLFGMFLLRQGLLSKITDNEFWYNLGKYTFSVYIMQEVVFRILHKTFWTNADFIHAYPTMTIIISLGITCVTGVLVYYLIERPVMYLYKNLNFGGGGGPLIRPLIYV